MSQLGSRAWRVTRAAVIARDGTVCRWCGADCSAAPTVDHLIPRKHGGSNHMDNLIVACRKCNYSRGSRLGPPPIFSDRQGPPLRPVTYPPLGTGKTGTGTRITVLGRA